MVCFNDADYQRGTYKGKNVNLEPAGQSKVNQSLQKIIYTPIVLMLLMATFLLVQFRSFIKAAEWVDHTDAVISQAQEAAKTHLDMESNFRGYLLTSDPSFLQFFKDSQPLIDSKFDELQKQVADNSSQKARVIQVHQLVKEWRRYAEKVISKKESSQDFIREVQAGTGKTITARIRSQTNDFIGVEEHLRAQRSDQAIRASQLLVITSFGLALILGLILAILGRRTVYTISSSYLNALSFERERTKELTAARKDLEKAHSTLEDRVKMRTNDLQLANRSLSIFSVLISHIQEYAIFMIDPVGNIVTWNPAANRITGYKANEIIGKNFSIFYTPEDQKNKHPQQELSYALKTGKYEEEGIRVRHDGSRFWANVIISPLYDDLRNHIGFVKVTRDITERMRSSEELNSILRNLRERTEELTQANQTAKEKETALSSVNQELETFCYSVSHDLRSPLRGIDGFSQMLLIEYGHQLDEKAKSYLDRIRTATQRMGQLIDDLLKLSRLTRTEKTSQEVNLTKIAKRIMSELRSTEPNRDVSIKIQDGLFTVGDSVLLDSVLENLLGNAWKFTSKEPKAEIEFGRIRQNEKNVFFVKDNGAGFNMMYADKLFGAFQRLHKVNEYPGTGIGLASVRRIIRRHNGEVWAKSEIGKGSTFYFTIDEDQRRTVDAA
jgi:PAS domain S-box-containing protein